MKSRLFLPSGKIVSRRFCHLERRGSLGSSSEPEAERGSLFGPIDGNDGSAGGSIWFFRPEGRGRRQVSWIMTPEAGGGGEGGEGSGGAMEPEGEGGIAFRVTDGIDGSSRGSIWIFCPERRGRRRASWVITSEVGELTKM